jgi:cobalamin biosynthesis Mg chelatase CobN
MESMKGKKEKTYASTSGFDVTKSRRSTSNIMDTIDKVGKTAANLANAGIGVAANAKALKNGVAAPGSASDGGGAETEQPSTFKKYMPIIIGGVVVVVLVVIGFVMFGKKK